MPHKNNSVDIAREHAEYVLRDESASQERKDRAAKQLVKIAAIKAMQRRDVRCLRLQKKLDAALARILELEAATTVPAQPQVFTSIREMVTGKPGLISSPE